MLNTLRKNKRLNQTIFLGALCVICFSVSVFRYFYTDSKLFLFLNWNLFLAFVPWLFSSLITIKPQLQQSKVIIILFFLAWLLFFPNAPYILTDLFHLNIQSSMPVWFDLILILSYAWVGLLFGFMSLWDIEKILSTYVQKKLIPVISIGLLFLSSFGVYLGRFLRWNSWDIIRDPFGLLHDVTDRLLNPMSHLYTWGMTIFMGLFLTMIYWSFKILKYNEVYVKGVNEVSEVKGSYWKLMNL
jgi:uncharacterized membrane protein